MRGYAGGWITNDLFLYIMWEGGVFILELINIYIPPLNENACQR